MVRTKPVYFLGTQVVCWMGGMFGLKYPSWKKNFVGLTHLKVTTSVANVRRMKISILVETLVQT